MKNKTIIYLFMISLLLCIVNAAPINKTYTTNVSNFYLGAGAAWSNTANSYDLNWETYAESPASDSLWCVNHTINVSLALNSVTANTKGGAGGYFMCHNESYYNIGSAGPSTTYPRWVNLTMMEGGVFTANITLPETCINHSDNHIEVCWLRTLGNARFYEQTYTYNYSVDVDNCSTYTVEKFRIRLWNSSNNSFVPTESGEIDIFVEFTDGTDVGNYSTSVTDNNQSICIAPYIESTFYGDLEIKYSISGSETYSYIEDDFLLNEDLKTIDLYLSEDTDFVTFTVTDSTDDAISNALIKIYEWDVGAGELKLTQQLLTDINGQTIGNIVLYTIDYKIQVYVDDVLLLDTTPSKIVSTEVNLVLNLESNYYADATTPIGGYAKMEFINTSGNDNFRFTWTDLPANVDSVCIDVDEVGILGQKDFSKTCVSSSSGTLQGTITPTQKAWNKTFVATGYFVVDETDILVVRTATHSYGSDYTTYGLDGVWVTFFIVLTIALVGIYSINVAIVLAVISFLGAIFMGFIYINMIWVVTLICIAIVIIARLNRK